MFLEKVYTGKNNWALYLVTLAIVFIAIQFASIPLLVYAVIKDPQMAMQGNISGLTSTNLGLALALFTFVGGFFALFLCIKYIHGKKYLDIVTARNKFDCKRFFFGAGIWTVLTLITIAIDICMAEPGQIQFQFEPLNFIALFIVALLFLPFQTSFEELVFRGYLMQWSALLFKYRWIALIVTSVGFGLMHSANPEVDAFGFWTALPIYIITGLILGYVAIKDDGLELAIGLHFANNLLAAITFTSDASALQTHALFKDINPSASYADSIVILLCGILFIYICNRKYHFFHKNNLLEKIENQPENTESNAIDH